MDIVSAFLILCFNTVGTVYKTIEANISLEITEIVCYSQRLLIWPKTLSLLGVDYLYTIIAVIIILGTHLVAPPLFLITHISIGHTPGLL